MVFRRTLWIVACFCGIGVVWHNQSTSLAAQDWPQLLGPTRDGHAGEGATLPAKLDGSLTPVWSVDCGQGYSGVAIASGRVIVFDRVASDERVRCLDLNDGKELWQQKLEATYRGGVDPASDVGPRAVPTIVGDRVVVYGAAGSLSCLQFQDGKVLWTRALRKELDAESGYFGAGSTPLIVNDAIIVDVGSKRKAGVVAVDLASGQERWSGFPGESSYASPIRLSKGTFRGTQAILVPTRLKSYGIDASNGQLLFEFPFGMRGPTVNAATPIELEGNQVFLTASYGIGAHLMKLEGNSPQAVYAEDSSLVASQYATPLFIQGRMLASDGREDMGTTSLKSFDPITRKLYWEESGTAICHLIGVNKQVIAVGIDGSLMVLGVETDRFEKQHEGKLPAGLFRGLPALSRGTLVVRDSSHANSQRIMAFR